MDILVFFFFFFFFFSHSTVMLRILSIENRAPHTRTTDEREYRPCNKLAKKKKTRQL